MLRIEVARVIAKSPRHEADAAGQFQPDRRDGADDPAEQDRDQIVRRAQARAESLP
jgi:hypothetical protein